MPVFRYKRYDSTMGTVEEAVNLHEHATDECPVSYIQPRSAELVRLYNVGKNSGRSLSQLLKDNSAQIEDAETELNNARRLVQNAIDKERERRRH